MGGRVQGFLAKGAARSLDHRAIARTRFESGFHNGRGTFEKIRCQRHRAAGTWRNTHSGLLENVTIKRRGPAFAPRRLDRATAGRRKGRKVNQYGGGTWSDSCWHRTHEMVSHETRARPVDGRPSRRCCLRAATAPGAARADRLAMPNQ